MKRRALLGALAFGCGDSMFSRRPGQYYNPNGGGSAPVYVAAESLGYPTEFVFDSASAADDLAVPQGVAFNPDLTRFYGTCKIPGEGAFVNKIYVYDAAYTELEQSHSYGAADGLPADTSQLNGITMWDGLLYIGYNNYATEPRTGGIVVVDPADIDTAVAVHPATNGHVEGCTIRNTARGPEAFVFSNTGTTIERYDLATWTLQGTHDFGSWAVNDPDAVYQGGGWFGDVMVLTLHGNQPRPQTIDACEWDDVALEFTPLYRLEKPTAYCGQGLNFTAGLATAYFAERNIIPTPDEYRIVLADVTSVAALPYSTTNGASAQLTDLQYWYQRLAWNAGASELQLPDTQGNGSPGTVSDGTRVYPIVAADGTRSIRFDGVDGAGIALGDLSGAGWTSVTFWFRDLVVYRDSTVDQIFSCDATGSNTGDGRIELNRTSARTVTLWYNDNAVALTSAGGVFTLGVPFDLCITLGPSGARIYVDGVQVATTATTGQIGGAGQACYLGNNHLLTAGAEFDCWDFRIYNAVKDPLVLATTDMWTDP